MADELIHSTAIIDWLEFVRMSSIHVTYECLLYDRVNSFELDITCESLSDISDGYILGEICHQM